MTIAIINTIPPFYTTYTTIIITKKVFQRVTRYLKNCEKNYTFVNVFLRIYFYGEM